MENLSSRLVVVSLQHATESAIVGIWRRRGFAREYGALLEETPGVLDVTWFSDEVKFLY
jgi:hypothetical protein